MEMQLRMSDRVYIFIGLTDQEVPEIEIINLQHKTGLVEGLFFFKPTKLELKAHTE